MAAKKTTLKESSSEIDPGFQPVVNAFRSHRDVTAGKLMYSYGLKVNGKIFSPRSGESSS